MNDNPYASPVVPFEHKEANPRPGHAQALVGSLLLAAVMGLPMLTYAEWYLAALHAGVTFLTFWIGHEGGVSWEQRHAAWWNRRLKIDSGS